MLSFSPYCSTPWPFRVFPFWYGAFAGVQRNYWCTTMCSIFQSSLTTLWCLPILAANYEILIASKTFDGQFEGLAFVMKFFVGYMASDLLGVVLYYNGKPDDVGFLVHHVAIVVVWTLLLVQNFGHTFALVCMLCEATQPFLGFKWIGDQFQQRGHPLYILNGLTIFFGWWVLRIGGYVSFLGYKFASNASAISGREVPALVCWLAGAVLQLWWGQKITAATVGALIALFKPPKKKRSD
jgi:hypothetical protein